ncbi:Pentatricopeptide repeat-containing protein [Hibiscus syriacus]|uniref:Pentatricopeptide repeat-containing protein n=1 Tax=Hibiscus syriacus TaxID=106335 RepID=A0A6A2ZBC8_HIBSY|nr:Pentatricopeptide repeat-containing protein [Hibiscus syriacus]
MDNTVSSRAELRKATINDKKTSKRQEHQPPATFINDLLVTMREHPILEANPWFPHHQRLQLQPISLTGAHFQGRYGNFSELFDDSAKKDVVPWSALTSGYAKRGELDVARRYFDEMPVKDLVSWNVMITAYAKRGYVLSRDCKKALEMFEEMKNTRERPDEVTMLSLLNACADLGDLQVGIKIHWSLSEMMSSDGFNVLLGNALIDMYAKCGSIERALKVFLEMREKDVSTWNSVIVGLAFHGHAEESINLFTKMRRSKVRPNEITFVGVLVACSHAGKVDEGRQCFKLMRDGYGIEPNIRHYGCMVDMLGRAGLLDEAFKFIDSMVVEPNAIIWRTLLGACRIHGNAELGRRANARLLDMRRDESGNYVLLSNIYASKGEWDRAEKLRKMMDDTGVRKEAGYSLIEAEEKEQQLLYQRIHRLWCPQLSASLLASSF